MTRLTRQGNMNKLMFALILETMAALIEISHRHYLQAMFPLVCFVILSCLVYLGERRYKASKTTAEHTHGAGLQRQGSCMIQVSTWTKRAVNCLGLSSRKQNTWVFIFIAKIGFRRTLPTC